MAQTACVPILSRSVISSAVTLGRSLCPSVSASSSKTGILTVLEEAVAQHTAGQSGVVTLPGGREAACPWHSSRPALEAAGCDGERVAASPWSCPLRLDGESAPARLREEAPHFESAHAVSCLSSEPVAAGRVFPAAVRALSQPLAKLGFPSQAAGCACRTISLPPR